MEKYRKKPVVVEAEQWFPGKAIEGVHLAYLCKNCGYAWTAPVDACPECFSRDREDCGLVYTLEGAHQALPGDYIITGVKGEKYPCKPDIFAMTYEPVGQE